MTPQPPPAQIPEYVCPRCRGPLVDGEGQLGCSTCAETFRYRDGAPILIWPHADRTEEDIIYSGGSDAERKSLLRRAFRLFSHRVTEAGWLRAVLMVPAWFAAKIGNRLLVVGSRLTRSTRVTCSCCAWRGWAFGTYWDPSEVLFGFECPVCSSHPRHRFLARRLRHWVDLDGGVILHTAPEPALEGVFPGGDARGRRITTDYAMTGVDCLSNLCHLPFPDDAFTGILCSHVLEHIEDDAKAMSEMCRVLKPGGVAVICVPEGASPQTVEFGFPDPLKTHHWRDYGRDVPERLRAAGFAVQTVTPSGEGEDVRSLGLSPNERVHLCSKSAGQE